MKLLSFMEPKEVQRMVPESELRRLKAENNNLRAKLGYDRAGENGATLFKRLIADCGATFPDRLSEINAEHMCRSEFMEEHCRGAKRVLGDF